jgi:hypothetical protein
MNITKDPTLLKLHRPLNSNYSNFCECLCFGIHLMLLYEQDLRELLTSNQGCSSIGDRARVFNIGLDELRV